MADPKTEPKQADPKTDDIAARAVEVAKKQFGEKTGAIVNRFEFVSYNEKTKTALVNVNGGPRRVAL